MAYGTTQTLVASAAYTASGNSAASTWRNDVGEYVSVLLSVTAVSGTSPTLTVSVQWSHDGSTWADGDAVDSFTQITAAKNVVKQFSAKGPYFRVAYAIAGTTPSFTFSATSYVTD